MLSLAADGFSFLRVGLRADVYGEEKKSDERSLN